MTARRVLGAGRPPGATPLTVKQAAPILGIDERSVRKRVAAGTLYAEHSETGPLLVWVPDKAIAAHRQRPAQPGRGPGPLHPGSGSRPDPALSDETIAAVVEAVRAELAAVREEWLTAALAQVGRLERQNAELAGRLVAGDRLVAQLPERVEQEERDVAAGQRCDHTPAHQTDASPEAAPTTSPASAPAAVPHRRQPWLLWLETRFDHFLRWVFGDELP